MSDPAERQAAEAAVASCYSTWADTYYRDYYVGAAYPPVHQDLVRRLLDEVGARRVLDAGCGPASMLRSLASSSRELYGFDLTPEMVREARRIMAPLGVPETHLWQGSVTEAAAFRPPGEPGGFDAAICIGVLPHVPAALDDAVIRNLRDAVVPGGLVLAEARNQLFALFTLNRYSHEFFLNDLIRVDALRAAAGDGVVTLDRALDVVRERFRTDLPPQRKGKLGEPGYDEVLSRTHNPFVLKEQFVAAGLHDVRVMFYHYHCLPPMAEAALPELFRRESLRIENPDDWRGYFMASAFIVAGRR
jgi:2-polyprenyl-3-methyl-5-hydroxy-6-metoxy-1,4-benzoquinol methylase